MSNTSKDKGRRGELDCMRFLEYLDWHTVDCATNAALEETNADCLMYAELSPEGTTNPEELKTHGLECQVKYSSGGSFGLQKIYNTHRERFELDLGQYTATEPSASETVDKMVSRSKSNMDLVYWEDYEVVTFPLDAVTNRTHNVLVEDIRPQVVSTDLKLPERHQKETENFDIFAFRKASMPWMGACHTFKLIGFLTANPLRKISRMLKGYTTSKSVLET